MDYNCKELSLSDSVKVTRIKQQRSFLPCDCM